MKKLDVHEGVRFGTRVVACEYGVDGCGNTMVLVECDCGDVASVRLHRLLAGEAQTCQHCSREKRLIERRQSGVLPEVAYAEHYAKVKASKYTGVSRNKARNRWLVGSSVRGRIIFIGSFKDEHQAAQAYDDFCEIIDRGRPNKTAPYFY